LKLDDVKMTAKQVREKSRAELAKIPVVQQALEEATQQLNHYHAALMQRYQNNLRLQTYAIVALGFERLIFLAIKN
jgi:phage gp36-like protein